MTNYYLKNFLTGKIRAIQMFEKNRNIKEFILPVFENKRVILQKYVTKSVDAFARKL